MCLTVFALTLHLTLTVVWTSAEGQPRVIGSPRPIVAALGNDVILPCHIEPLFNVEGLTVEWSKPDLKPDPSDPLSRVEYVHLYRDRREDLDMKIQAYEMRTELFIDKLKYGDVSLKIMNVTLEDRGRYRCYIPKLKSDFKESVVELFVEQKSVQTTTETQMFARDVLTPEPKNGTTVIGGRSHVAIVAAVVFLGFLILVGGVTGYLHRHGCQKPKLLQNDDQSKLSPV
ncbi:myelin-oligodendrocyte glycoprotein-like [Acanthopagrus latus]|uniref:myelin-oligodendrocyte glycoprotein-like n=1 Tax=Acanthopagrus latus TaxID=8177 RepID=UPI00187C09ED|nr:myelin-oligodendrocyte glycoprotein-like [Acanthopagrus latus]